MNLNRYTYGGSGSHWEGCHESHWDCRLEWQRKQIEYLTREVDRLQSLVVKLSEPDWYFDDSGDTCTDPEEYASDMELAAGSTFTLRMARDIGAKNFLVTKTDGGWDVDVVEVPNE